ncbi:MAG: flagellar hook-length control protein FliK [Suilimivivens sp.]
MAGQSVTGEVIEKNGNEILLAIGKNQMLRAKLDAGIPVEEGQLMTFSVKNTGGAKVVLSPLYANTGNDPNISKALQMAGIPETDSSAKMVKIMMQEGMSIDRDSLNQMARTVNLNEGANIETLVQLTRLEIPVTENNIFQMESYKNFEHQITEGLLEITDALMSTVSEMKDAGNVQDGISLYREVISLLTEQEFVVPEEGEKIKGDQEEVFPDREPLTQTFSRELTEAGIPEETVKAFAAGEISNEKILSIINEHLLTEKLPAEKRESVEKLLFGREFNQLLKNEIIKQWMITPEEVAEDNKVERFYDRLSSQLSRLNQVLEQTAKTNTPLGRTTTSLSGNIDFMNQLNQMFTYVQLPLKLQGQEASGELYVYTNKKNLAKKEGEISALLHLDMEHLGSVDVHVTMKDNKVSTKFYLKDDSALDLIADHIDILNERLNKRGYSVSASFLKKGEEESDCVMEEMLKQDKNISVLSGYSFDARA